MTGEPLVDGAAGAPSGARTFLRFLHAAAAEVVAVAGVVEAAAVAAVAKRKTTSPKAAD